MKITKIDLPGNPSPISTQRCERLLNPSFFDSKKMQCKRFARIEIDGARFCIQHAGEFALKYLIDRQDSQE